MLNPPHVKKNALAIVHTVLVQSYGLRFQVNRTYTARRYMLVVDIYSYTNTSRPQLNFTLMSFHALLEPS
jgi:hypothetical protein